MLSRERRIFFLRWLRNPVHVGVPIPSSRALAEAMAAQLSGVSAEDYIVELGPGTGVVTRALCQAGIRPDRLIIIERDHSFLQTLRKDFPKALILQGDAFDLQSLLQQHQIGQVGAVVSSLPLLSMPPAVRHALTEVIFGAMKTPGIMVQYTYGFTSPISRKYQRMLGIRAQLAQRVWANFPPARVWRYSAERHG